MSNERRLNSAETLDHLKQKHSTDVDSFLVSKVTNAMAGRLADKRREGFSGWDNMKAQDFEDLVAHIVTNGKLTMTVDLINVLGMLLVHEAPVETVRDVLGYAFDRAKEELESERAAYSIKLRDQMLAEEEVLKDIPEMANPFCESKDPLLASVRTDLFNKLVQLNGENATIDVLKLVHDLTNKFEEVGGRVDIKLATPPPSNWIIPYARVSYNTAKNIITCNVQGVGYNYFDKHGQLTAGPGAEAVQLKLCIAISTEYLAPKSEAWKRPL